MNTKVSVITPIYKGKKFISGIIDMLECCAKQSGMEQEIELVLSCDDPEEDIGDLKSESIKIIVLYTDHNRGVQVARIRGVDKCTGEYVVFLDQDDKIFPEYFKSQLASIREHDAVVCRALNGGKAHYTKSYLFEEVVSRDWLLKRWNSILSPGQVLIRKKAIPKLWKQKILKNRGADDYFLWLCMLARGSTFALNQSIEFDRRLDYANNSHNAARMLASNKEMFDILQNEDDLDKGVKDGLNDLYLSIVHANMDRLTIFRQAYYYLNALIKLEKNAKITRYFEGNMYHNIAVYGAGELGRQIMLFFGLIYDAKFFFIDRNADCLKIEEECYGLNDIPSDTDLIIISLPEQEDIIKNSLDDKCRCPVMGIGDFIDEVLNQES